ncbi:MAG: putative lipid II flippase FtsW [Candidatus Krumholzibacteriota bacterium]|nr:putative lipid II flippase FtsW [Candidatus Krumholzibacteriota bacterium]
MTKKSKYDLTLFCVTLLLVSLGLIMVFSASNVIGREKFKSSFFFMQNHMIRVAIGLCCFFIFTRIPVRIYRKSSVWILVTGIILLAALFVFGRNVRGCNRWLPLFSFMLQPVEVAKFALIIYIASTITESRKKIKRLKDGFLPLMGVVLLIALLVGLQPNLSNSILIIMLSFVLIFIGGCRLVHLLSFGAGLIAVAVPVLYSFDHVRERVSVLFNSGVDAQGAGYHINQSLIALGSGFIFGAGPGNGHQKFNYLPDAHTDFIYSIIGEELGIVGTATVLILFFVIFRRAVRIAKRANNDFGYLLSIGIGLMIFSTALINISMTLGLIPVAGLPLPFVSYGGSSLVTSLSAMGILLSISSSGRDQQGATKRIASAARSRIYARKVAQEETR